MAIINVETPQGIVKVEIAGDQPTQQEEDAIRSQFFGQQRKDLTFDDLLQETKPKGQTTTEIQSQQSNFDTESGIQDFGLRSALSVAENNAEEASPNIIAKAISPRKRINASC